MLPRGAVWEGFGMGKHADSELGAFAIYEDAAVATGATGAEVKTDQGNYAWAQGLSGLEIHFQASLDGSTWIDVPSGAGDFITIGGGSIAYLAKTPPWVRVQNEGASQTIRLSVHRVITHNLGR